MILTLLFSLSIRRQHLVECTVIFRTTQRQHLIATILIPPGPRAFQTDMTDEFVRRFNATTAQRLASTAKLAIMRTTAMCIEMNPAVVNGFEPFVRGRLHAPQATQDGSHLSLIQPRQGRFDPFERL